MTRHKARPKLDYPKRWTPKKCRPAEPSPITDHAVIRYLERVMEIDVERLRLQMLSDGRAALIQSIGTGRLNLPEGATLVIVGCKVVSVVRTEDVRLGSRVRKTAD